MKINLRNLEAANHMSGNRPLSISFYDAGKKAKSSHLDYHVYKLCTNPKDEKSMVYSLMVGLYEVGTPEAWLQFMETMIQVIK
eukprot:20756-Ditylum_brightwellii.AAC.1